MPQDGGETLAVWREAGEWWQGEPPREVRRYLDKSGAWRQQITPLEPSSPAAPSGVRVRKLRDDKVRQATGIVTPPEYGTARLPKEGAALHLLSGYAFGRGTMIAAELPAFAALRGYRAALLADPFSLVGAREFADTAHKLGVQPLIGATFEMADGGEVVLLAKNPCGYRSLSRLVTDCHLGEPRNYPLCTWERLERHSVGLRCLTGGGSGLIDRLLIRRDFEGARAALERLIGLYGREDVFVQVERSCLPWGSAVESWLLSLAKHCRVVAVAGGPAFFEHRGHFPAHDVLVCIDTLCTVDEIEGRKPPRDPTQPQAQLLPRRSLNAERYFSSYRAVCKRFCDRPDLVENALRVADGCEPNVLPGRTQLPKFCENEDETLRTITMLGARMRYQRMNTGQVKRLDHELKRIARLNYSRHFLVAWDMCNWARENGILLSGRGSVVDSLVSYCLGFSRIDAHEFNLHFDRFLPSDGSKRPDIDIDFEAHRREDVRQYLVQKYGDAHVATVAAIGTYCSRGIIREVGKVMGIPDATLGFLAKRLHGGVSADRLEAALDSRPELRDSNVPRERFRWVFKLAERLMDLPRNIRSHSSGVVVSADPLADTVPVMQSAMDGVRIIQWDKRSAKHCFDKFDVLCLRGNDVLGGTARKTNGAINVTDLPLDDPEVFRAMRAGALIGIPQSASPAMRQAHIRIKTNSLKDAGIVQAGIRPGVGGAVKLNEYIARRGGKKFKLVHEHLEPILGPTLGIVVFQEQIDQLLQTFGGYSGDEAETIREGIHKNKRDFAQSVQTEVVARIVSRGYTAPVAMDVCKLVAGFKGYGFAEGHALAFAEVSIRSIWCQQNYPAPYFAALLDAQPAGYYGPATIANEARSRGVRILSPSVDCSGEDFIVEDVRSDSEPHIVLPAAGLRVSLRQVSGLSVETRERIIGGQPYESFFDCVVRAAPNSDELVQLVLCGAFDAHCPNRRALLWAVPDAVAHGRTQRNHKGTLPLFVTEPDIPMGVEDFSAVEKAVYERQVLGLDVATHLVGFERERIMSKGGLTAAQAATHPPGTEVFVVGNPIRLRFPPTESGRRVMFFDLEDETGLLNVTCFDDVYQRDGHKVICNPYVTLWGTTQDRDGHLSFLARRVLPYHPLIRSQTRQDVPLPVVVSDFMMR